MTAILLAFAAAAFLGARRRPHAVRLAHRAPAVRRAISIPAFTLVFLLLSPILLRGDAIVWQAVPIFAAVGLVFPAVLTLLDLRRQSRARTGGRPARSATFAAVLGRDSRSRCCTNRCGSLQFAGLVIAVLGVLIVTVTRTADMRDWRTWALLLPLAASLLRGVDPAGRSRSGSRSGRIRSRRPDRLHLLIVDRAAGRAHPHRPFIVQAPLSGRLWFAVTGICNGIGTLCCSTPRSAPGRSRWWRRSIADLSAGDGGA